MELSNTDVLQPPISNKLPTPLIILAKENSNFNDSVFIQSEINKLDVGLVKFYRISEKNNLVIFPTSFEAKEKIEANKSFFKDFKIFDSENIDKRPMIIIKDLSYDLAQSLQERLSDNGVTEVLEIKHRNQTDNRVIKKVKAVCDSTSTRDNLLKNGIILGYKLYRTELSFKQPTQCFKCFSLEHLAANCHSENHLCGSCLQVKHDGKCTSNSKCSNCGGSHSSLYKGCPKYVAAKKSAYQRATTNEPALRKNTANQGFIRTFSDVTANNNNKNIESMFEALMKQNAELKSDMQNNLTQINQNLSSFAENFPSRQEFEDRIVEVVADTNHNLTCAMNTVINVVHDVLKLHLQAQDADKLKEEFSNACRKNIDSTKDGSATLAFKTDKPKFFKVVIKRPPSAASSVNSSLDNDEMTLSDLANRSKNE